jgi:transketolase
MRCFEQIRVDVAYMQTNVKIVGVGGGLAYGAAGATHHAIEDLAIAKALPGMTVCAPCDPVEARQLFEQSFQTEKPMYIRLAKNGEPCIHSRTDKITLGKSFTLSQGKDMQILTCGTIAHRVNEWLPELLKQRIRAGITTFPTIKPLDTEFLDTLITLGIDILIVEEHNVVGGLGESICTYLGKKNAQNKIRHIGIPDIYSHYVGSQPYILNKFGLYAVPDINVLFSKELP